MVIDKLLINTFAAVASRFARLSGRICGVEGILDKISSAVPRAFCMVEGR